MSDRAKMCHPGRTRKGLEDEPSGRGVEERGNGSHVCHGLNWVLGNGEGGREDKSEWGRPCTDHCESQAWCAHDKSEHVYLEVRYGTPFCKNRGCLISRYVVARRHLTRTHILPWLLTHGDLSSSRSAGQLDVEQNAQE